MSTVILKKCTTYDDTVIQKEIDDIFSLLGGIDNLIKENDKVFIKLNCLGPFAPEKGITTHPAILRAVIKKVKEKTNNIIVGDNPAIRDIIYTMKKCSLYDVCVEENVSFFNPKNEVIITNSNPSTYKEFLVSKDMVEADVLINLPKLKTHSLAYMTCAEKNFFGLIYGLNKSAWHTKASNPLDFGEAINDLFGAFLEKYKYKTLIHILDGIIGLEGEGPSTSGIMKKADVILASVDAVSLDEVACHICSLDPNKLYITRIAAERGYGEGNINNIKILGNKLEDFKDLSFLPPKDSLTNVGLRILRIKMLCNLLLEHPKLNSSVCIKCGECAKICPQNAMTIVKGKVPSLKSKKCIRCWCCLEVCPQNALTKTKRPLPGRIILRNK